MSGAHADRKCVGFDSCKARWRYLLEPLVSYWNSGMHLSLPSVAADYLRSTGAMKRRGHASMLGFGDAERGGGEGMTELAMIDWSSVGGFVSLLVCAVLPSS
jgi:hypothetical protein